MLEIKGDVSIFEDIELVKECLEETEKYYRPLDPGWYLYKKITQYKTEQKFKNEFIELVYVTLCAWNMNSRAAKLQEYKQFKESIIRNQKEIERLNKFKLEEILDKKDIIEDIKKLFEKLDLVEHNKPKLVAYSKTLHFFMPNLVCPIDRKHILKFFYGNTHVRKRTELQQFTEIQKQCGLLMRKTSLKQYIDVNSRWNLNITKIIDNIIIGYQIKKVINKKKIAVLV